VNMSGEVAENIGDLVYVNAIPLRLMYVFPEIQPNPGVQWSIYSKLYSKFLTLLNDSSSSTIVVNSKYLQDVIKRQLGKNAFVINPPVISNRIISESNHKVRNNTVVTVSRFRSAKGLAIIPKIASYMKDCDFILIGIVDSSSERCLKELSEEIERLHVQDRVHIFKNKPYSFTLSALSNAKVFLHTQNTEAFGMSVVESMAAGCVPVVPRAGGPWLEILDQQEGLYGFSYKNPREAADKIRLLINDESLRREISARAAERAMIFDSSTFEKKFLNLVETISCNVNSTPE
jgi:glycosyltransferase involved in cell wall biosynthesis